ncbi:MAG: hypothetical protein HY518_01675 [Candidatus Aenigmarchaeota archaeon]|nr:hypothetical protein [Candidatus Aenigmarchaeota archaeon]
MFVRKKLNHGQHYAYLVRSSWVAGKGPRQKVGKYLGKVVKPERTGTELFKMNEETLAKAQFKEMATALLLHELKQHGFGEKEGMLVGGDIAVDSGFRVTRKGRPAVLELNNGFLSEETIQYLLNYSAEKDPKGEELARRLVGAGVAASEEAFIALFEKARPATKEEEALPEDFYY